MSDVAGIDSWDFFVSYTQADRDWAEWIAWQLEEAGHRVLIQAWDILPGDNWITRTDQGVRRAARTIAVVSPDYLASIYGTAEWQAAWRDDPLGEARKLVPVRVRDTARDGLMAQHVGVDLFDLTEAAARRRLNEAITAVLAGRARPPGAPGFPGGRRALRTEPRFPGSLPEIWNPPARNPNFTGRDADLDRLRRALRDASTVATCAMHGMGGIGKTQLAIEYVYRHATDYDLIWWITADEIPVLVGQLADLAARLDLPGRDTIDAAAAVLDYLRHSGRWLLIYDNAEEPQTLRPWVPAGPGHVLITTRRGGYDAVAHTIDVDILTRAEAVALLHRRLPHATAGQAEQIAAELGDLPLALEQAAAYLRSTSVPIGDYLGWLRRSLARVINRGSVAGREETLATLWEMSRQRLIGQRPAAVQLLQLCAWLAPEGIPLDLFTAHADLLPEPLRQEAADLIEFADTVAALVDYSLARRTEHHLSLHRLVQATTRHTARPARGVGVANGAETRPLTTVLKLLAVDLPADIVDTPEDWPRWVQLLSHVLVAAEHQEQVDTSAADDTSYLLDRAAMYLRVQGQATLALPLAERALVLAEAGPEPDQDRISIRLDGLAQVLQDLGRPADAQPLLERALAIGEASYGPDHPTVATDLSNLALVLMDLGRPGDARPLLERALAIGEASYGPDHPTVATDLSNLALVLKDLGRPGDAQPLLERALAIGEASYGPDHPTVATRLSNLALVLKDLGRPGDARPLLERALAIGEASYGPDHPAVATDLSNLALVLKDLGRPGDARPLLERALAIGEASYGPDHPAVATDLNNLALVLQDLGRPADARPLLERALAIGEASYGPDHPAVATDLSNLAAVLQDLGRPGDARPLLERALAIEEASYGPDHPAVATDLNNLALVLQDLGRPADARPLLERALAIEEASYGPDHPTVATRLNILALVLQDLGQPANAQLLFRRAAQIRLGRGRS